MPSLIPKFPLPLHCPTIPELIDLPYTCLSRAELLFIPALHVRLRLLGLIPVVPHYKVLSDVNAEDGRDV